MKIIRNNSTGLPLLESDAVLEADITELADVVSESPFVYFATSGEVAALDWIGDRYAIATLLFDHLEDGGEDWGNVRYHITIDPREVQEALSSDGVDRVPCLDESTALARIIWAIGPDE
tara:strand:+ start:207 stop:563 length:357 start_codon:yes stop_codon:yes gene_type:complete